MVSCTYGKAVLLVSDSVEDVGEEFGMVVVVVVSVRLDVQHSNVLRAEVSRTAASYSV